MMSLQPPLFSQCLNVPSLFGLDGNGGKQLIIVANSSLNLCYLDIRKEGIV
jgi:hypothetical protein